MTILDLIPKLKRLATTNGGEYAGPCPFCGGNDRFRVWPEQGPTGRYWCRGCGKKGDGIQLLRDHDGLGYLEACARLGVMPSLSWTPGHRSGQATMARATWEPRQATIPGNGWQEKARFFLRGCQKFLGGSLGTECRAFLFDRGLKPETIERAGLGWNIETLFDSREAWGLPPETKEDGKPKKIWLPSGLVIPCFAGGQVVRLRLRRPHPGEGPRYAIIPGSSFLPMTWGLDKGIILIVESELDGLLLLQEAGDLAGVIALGSAQIRPDRISHEALGRTDLILNCLDSDGPGAKEAWSWWRRTYKNVLRWPVPIGKDPSEAFQKGLDLRAWIMAGLPDTVPEVSDPLIKPESPIQVNSSGIVLEFDFEDNTANETASLEGVAIGPNLEPQLMDFDEGQVHPKPYLDKWGDLVIPYTSDSRYWWWNGGQSISETLKELSTDEFPIHQEVKI